MITAFKNAKISYWLLIGLCCAGFLLSYNLSYANGVYCGWECSPSSADVCTDIDNKGEPSNCGCQPQLGGQYYYQCNDPNVCSGFNSGGCPGYGSSVYDSTGAYCGICSPECQNGSCSGCGCGGGGSGSGGGAGSGGGGGGLPSGHNLIVGIASGSGTITGTNGIDCPATKCSGGYENEEEIVLVATPSSGYTFGSWTNSCRTQGSVCGFRIDKRALNSAYVHFASDPFNYSLSNSGTSNVTKVSGGNAYTQNTITKSYISGIKNSVNIFLSGIPSGIPFSIANNPCSPTCISTITFTVTPGAIVGTYPITVTGQPLGKTTNFNLIVSGAPISVSCAPSPSTALLGQTVTWSGTITGGTPPYTYTWTGTNIPTSPAPSTNPYQRTYSTIGQKTATLTVKDKDLIQSSCPQATVQINFDPKFEEF